MPSTAPTPEPGSSRPARGHHAASFEPTGAAGRPEPVAGTGDSSPGTGDSVAGTGDRSAGASAAVGDSAVVSDSVAVADGAAVGDSASVGGSVGGVSEPAWTGRHPRLARAVMWTLPAYAALTLVGGLGKETPDAASDFGRYAAYVVTDEYRYRAVSTLVDSWLGLLSLIALGALLAGTRTRYVAMAGLFVGLVGSMLTLTLQGVRVLSEPSIGRAYLRGEQTEAAIRYAGLLDIRAGELALVGVLFAVLGWLLLAAATARSQVLNPTDGYLLALAAVLRYAGGYLPILHVCAGLLLLAAALGLAFAAHRLVTPAGRIAAWRS